MISPSANHEAFIKREKEDSSVETVEDNQYISYETIQDVQFKPRKDLLEELSPTE